MAVATSTRPADVGLKREMGFIGACWASVTSIIGSGWLFGAWKGAYSTGTSAILAWIIGGVCIIILALVHAELGGMYPVSGGTARFPHFAFGSVAGISFGFFSWIQAVTVAPIEVFAVMQYGSYYWHGLFNDATGEVTTVGFVMSILLMAVFTAINFLADAPVQQGEQRHHLVEGRHPHPCHHRPAVPHAPQQLQLARRVPAAGHQGPVRRDPRRRHRVRLPRLRAGRPARR